MWAIPGGMVDPGETMTTTLKREFIEETLNSRNGNRVVFYCGKENMCQFCFVLDLVEQIEKFLKTNGTEVYCGYVDDPRNTDNAWIETTAHNFHDENGVILEHMRFEAGDDAQNVRWLDIDGNISLYANHREMIAEVVKLFDAHW